MEINKEWFKKDFEQKFYLCCNNSEFSIQKVAELKNKPYISKIKITEK